MSSGWKGYLIDHHWPDAPGIRLERLSLEQYAKLIGQAQIDSLTVYCKDHWGHCYYPTELGRRHPAISFDLVGATAEMLGRLGVEFIAYYSVGFDEHAARSHPEWLCRDATGGPMRHPKGPLPKWHRLCLETGYMDFVVAHLMEILGRYQADSVFLDILGHPPGTYWGAYLCYCLRCRELFRGKYGLEMPAGLAAMRAKAFEIEDFKAYLDQRWFEQIRGAIKKTRPEVAIMVNCSAHFRRPVREQIDRHFTEPFWGHWRSGVFMRGVGAQKQPRGGAEVVSNVYDPRPVGQYKCVAAANIAQGIRPLIYSPSQRPDGWLDKVEFERVGAAYGEISEVEEFLEHRQPVRCVGVLYHERTCVELPDVPYGAASPASAGIVEADRNKPDNTHRKLTGAAVGLVSYAQMPVGVLAEDDLNEQCLRGHRVLVVGSASRMTPGEAEVIERFVEQGGSLIVSGDSGLRDVGGDLRGDFLLAEAMGVHFERIEDRFEQNQWGGYLARTRHPMWRGLPDTDLPLPPPLHVVRLGGAEALATHMEPCVAVGPDRWASWWSPGPGRVTEHPAVTYHRFGKGQVVYFAANPFTDALIWMRTCFAELLTWLMGSAPIRVRVRTPAVLGSSFWRRDNGTEVIVHLVNLGIENTGGEVVRIGGARIEVDESWGQIKRAKLVLPKSRELNVGKRGSIQSVRVPPIEVHSIVVLEMGS